MWQPGTVGGGMGEPKNVISQEKKTWQDHAKTCACSIKPWSRKNIYNTHTGKFCDAADKVDYYEKISIEIGLGGP